MVIFDLITEEKKRLWQEGLSRNFKIRAGKHFLKQLKWEFGVYNYHLPKSPQKIVYLGVDIIRDRRLKSYKICKN